jgi:uncharacterized protein YndB with AHSA1/START domain
MSTSHKTVASEELTLTITREFDAPRELVFAAWTEPERIRQWSCAKDFTFLFSEGDVKPGGTWRSGMRAPDGEEFIMGGTYQEVSAYDRLSFTHQWEEDDGSLSKQTLVNIVFEDIQGKTRMIFTQTGFASEKSCKSHEGGWSEFFDKLSAYLTNESQQR